MNESALGCETVPPWAWTHGADANAHAHASMPPNRSFMNVISEPVVDSHANGARTSDENHIVRLVRNSAVVGTDPADQ